MHFLKFFLAGLAIIVSSNVLAIDLPAPERLAVDYGLRSQKISVVEPHESTPERLVVVDYTALPMDTLLTKWFGDRWKADGAEIVFFAQDGYRSVIANYKLKKYRSFLAYARDDGSAFVVDNLGQNQQQISLNPYYLIWDNRSAQELIRQGAYGWPYQVIAIELHQKKEDLTLFPRKLSNNLKQGLAETKEFCLTCHNIRGIGGKKHVVDLVKASCRWSDADLKAWIESPSRFKPGTTMPSLGRMLPANERNQIINRIVNYLDALKAELSGSCVNQDLRD